MGGVVAGYWKLTHIFVDSDNNKILATMTPFLNQAAETGGKQRMDRFAKRYEMTFAQGGLGSTGLGGKNVGNFLRDTILSFLLANESDFTGGTLV